MHQKQYLKKTKKNLDYIYYPYWQYTDLFIFRFVISISAYAAHYIYIHVHVLYIYS